MDEARLSAYERRVLAEIEEQLSADVSLARRLSGARPLRRWPRLPLGGGHGPRRAGGGWFVACLGAATLTLLVLAVATEAPALIWAFAAVWVLTLVGLLRLVVRWTRRHAAGPTADTESG